jgi:heme oxygenase
LIISEEIKNATTQSHHLLEKLVVEKIRSISTLNDYADLLRLFFSYFGGLELLIDEHLSTQYFPDLHDRRKAALISQDLQRLGEQVPKMLDPKLLPAIKNRHQALGALYVIEGSSLGGKHIEKMIRNKLPDAANEFLFFVGYGDKTTEMWNGFKNVLNNISGNQHEIDDIISGACDTFLKFTEWINSNLKSKTLT